MSKHKCELCGSPVKVYSGDEGTNSYEPDYSELYQQMKGAIMSIPATGNMRRIALQKLDGVFKPGDAGE